MMHATLLLVAALLQSGTETSESGLKYHLIGGGGGVGGGARKPMIIFLHGTGGGAMVWSGYARAAQAKGYLCVLPYSTGDGRDDPKSGNQGDTQRRWAEVDVPKLVSLAKEMQHKHGADPRRTYVTGFSNGGFYAFEAGLRHPEVFSAVLCMGAGCNVHNFSEAAKQVGCYIVHGTSDTSVKFESGKGSADRLKAAGFRDVVFREYPGRGHEVFQEEADKYFAWLAKQKRAVTPGASATIPWKSDLPAALKDPGKKVLAYFVSPSDTDSDLVDLLELELFADKGFPEAAGGFECVRVNRDEDPTAKELGIKAPTLAVLEIRKDKPAFAWKAAAGSTVAALLQKLKALGAGK